MTDQLDLFVSPLGRVEGDLDVRVTIEDGVVTSAWTEAAMFRGFEIIQAMYQSVLTKSAVELPMDRNLTPLEEIMTAGE